MGSIWDFIDEPEHFGKEQGSADKDFPYGLDTTVETIIERLESYLSSPNISATNKEELEKDLKDLKELKDPIGEPHRLCS